MQFSVILVTLFALAVSAAPVEIQKRSTTCGHNIYTTAQVDAASKAACAHIRAGTVVGIARYPHQYKNYERFIMSFKGPYYEFPIKARGVYTGGPPGADRVLINARCNQVGQITHTGALNNGFAGCSGTS
ncbi:ribonuclease [Colletotrichum orchidophilum]|uniref:ribonuclease T1 n=1 Tax=Colletotrichum orchidophilum TaxID=1209926 RepID=A0A1G4BAG3_9PEZI|nr:ribonuclease [Colletotrichum orchidophilum]OHE98282.1 ribonuclease [Colletotrichum orchidophilum]